MANFNAVINGFGKGLMQMYPGMSQAGANVLSGIFKLATRYGAGVTISRTTAALILTQAEEAVLLKAGARFVVNIGGRIFVYGAIAGLAADILFPGVQEPKTIEDRIKLVGAHVLKGSNPFVIAFSAVEQTVFAITDGAGTVINFAGELATDFVTSVVGSFERTLEHEPFTISNDEGEVISGIPDLSIPLTLGGGHRLFNRIDP